MVIKLGTLAPNGSTWHTLLKEMGQKWEQASGGKVKLRIYPGGVLGNEGDMVKKMRIGQLQAAALTTIGLHDIAPEPQAVDVPMMIDSWATLDYVMDRMAPKLERIIESKGYVVIGWSEVGFVRFFSTKKYSTLAELQNAKMFCWEGDPASAEAWRAGGFHPVVMSSTDIVPVAADRAHRHGGAGAAVRLFVAHVREGQVHARSAVGGAHRRHGGAQGRVGQGAGRPQAEADRDLARVRQEDRDRGAAHGRRRAREHEASRGWWWSSRPIRPTFAKAAQKTYSVIRGKVVPAETFDEVKKLVDEAHAQSAKK